MTDQEYKIREKESMVREFIRETRERKKNAKNMMFKHYLDMFELTDETVELISFINKTTVRTEMYIHPKNNKLNMISYPKTEWGGPGVRWDSELREFLLREIVKE